VTAAGPHESFRRAVEASDLDAMVAALAEDAVLRSPVSFKPFEGRAAIAQLFAILLDTFEGFRYTDELSGGPTAALIFEARVGDREVQGLDLIRFDPEGRIRELTVMVRPLSAAIALAEAVGPRLEAATT
jgi:hypothetical protein